MLWLQEVALNHWVFLFLELQKRLCVLENNVFKYFDPERITAAKDEIECSELLSIAECQPEQATKAG